MSVTFKPIDYTASPMQRFCDQANAVFDEAKMSPTRTAVVSTNTIEDDGTYGSTEVTLEQNRVNDLVLGVLTPILPVGSRDPVSEFSEGYASFERHPATSLVTEFGDTVEGLVTLPLALGDELDRVEIASALSTLTDYSFFANDFVYPLAHPTRAGVYTVQFVGDHPYYVGTLVYTSSTQ